MLVNTRGVPGDGVKDKVFHAPANLGIPLSDRQEYKNLPRLCTGTGKSTRVSKICSPRRGLPSRGHCKSLTRGWIFLSLYEDVVDYFSPTALNLHNKTTPFAFKNYFKTLSA